MYAIYTAYKIIDMAVSKRSKAIPVTGRGVLYVSTMSMVPYFLENLLRDGGEVVRLRSRPRSIPQKYFLVVISVRG
jgi:hypothetical protein